MCLVGMFVALHSKVVHVQAPFLLSGAVDVGDHPAAVDRAAHRGAPDGADGALEVLALRHGLLQSHQPPAHHVATRDPDQTVLVEPDLRFSSLARWCHRGNLYKETKRLSSSFLYRGLFSYLTSQTFSASLLPSWDSLRSRVALWT